MLDTFLYGTGCLLVLAKLLDVPAPIAVPMAILGALAVTVDVGRELKRLAAEPYNDGAGEGGGTGSS